ncbi:MAG: sulfurtransferase [Bacteroidales bacterium]
MKPLIKPHELLEQSSIDELIMIDARQGADSLQKYQSGHLKDAFRVDLESDLSDIKDHPRQGGRHPLPTPEAFGRLLGKLGITPQAHVVVYDDQNGANAAARFWWMLRAAGHQKVQVLDGGFQAALKAGWPVSTRQPVAEQQPPYPVKQWQLPLADMQQVEHATRDHQSLVIDVREAGRYKGEYEPYEEIAGHIPGAINIPYSENQDQEGFFHAPQKLRELYAPYLNKVQEGRVIVHCGSGVSACPTLLALAHAGFEIPALYVGSFSEWSRNEKPVATGDL